MEKELLAEVKMDHSKGEPAPTLSTQQVQKPIDSRDISPHTKTAPAATTGAAIARTEEAPQPTTSVGTPSGSKADQSLAHSPPTDKKKKRTSIFGKLKAKFSERH